MLSEQRTVYCSCAPVIDVHYDRDGGQTLEQTLIEALAEVEGVSPTDLPPLYESVDLDALSRLFEEHDGAVGAGALFSFNYERWNVFVRADGRVHVCDGTESTDLKPVFETTSS